MQKRRQGMTIWLVGAALTTWSPVPAWSQGGIAAQLPSTMIWALALLLMLATVIGALLIWRRQEHAAERHEADVPPLLFPAAPASRPRSTRSPSVAQASGLGVAPAPPVEAPQVEVRPTPQPAPALTAGAPQTSAPPKRRVSVAAPAVDFVPPAPGPDSLVDGKTIRFHRPVDGTLQMLPGRLDIVEGEDKGQTIRFVRAGASPEVTFGRSEGPAYRHIQLRAPTVSRKHAHMRYRDSIWSIRNLSTTNPVVVNGEDLSAEGSERTLREGDRIEMGEIAFVFRER
jgi:membrane protein implicated in regulation of membrane protease activity